MKVLTVGIIIFIYICSYNIAAAELGDACTVGANDNCTDTGQKCAENGTCACDTASNYNYDGSKCVIDINECSSNPCQNGGACNDGVNGYTCNCVAGYTGKNCQTNINECSSNPCQNGGACNDGVNGYTCNCVAGYTGKNCQTNIDDCATNPCLNGGTCTDRVNDFTCACRSGFSSKRCDKAALGVSCSVQGTICQDINSECGRGNMCVCKNSHYDSDGTNNIGGTCVQRRGLGGYCSTSQPVNADQCKDANARCTFSGPDYRCSCNDRYHQGGSVCVLDKALGEFCNNANECSGPNAGCLGNKCTCDQQHYQYKPSGGAKDVCEKVEQLKVIGISFSNIQTTQFTVSWTPPAGKESYISGYTVEWRPTDNSGSGDSRNVSLALQQTLKGLTPGRTYEVKVISRNTATQPGSTRSTFSKRNQAAEPSKPGLVTSTPNDLDARDNRILIKWGTSDGVTTQYSVKLIDSTEVNYTTSISRTAWISHNTLKDGYIYTVHIEARSQAYDGNYLWSEKRISTIKTKVQVPDPPRNGICKDPTDKSITLEWSEPADTKGDLVKYHIRVYQFSNTVKSNVSTTGTETQLLVGGLDSGTSYTFWIYAENEMYNSTYNRVATGCKTKAKMSEPPTNLNITSVTSRSFDISWMKPTETHSAENYGYVLQIKDDQDKCVKEIIYRCSNCSGQFLISELNGLCSSGIQPEIGKTKQELEGQLTYPASLNPDIAYTVTVTAINDAGRGYPASDTERTKEEAPQKPDNVMMEDVMAKSVKVTWNIADPRPGKTTYKITLDAQEQADDKVIVVEGFENRSCTFSNLEEFWSYQVTVNASTAIGSNISDVKEIKTLPAAPGNVLSFRPINAPSDNYRKLKIVWKAPELLERNSIITNYSFRHNTTGVFQTEMLNQETDFTHEYSVMVDVVPEEYYSFEVFAINEQNENGSVSYLNKQAVAGVPKNIENTTQIKVIPKEKVKDVQQTQFTVTFVQEFFEQSENGQIRATGLVACVESKCSTSNIEDLSDFNNMDTWKEASKGTYRVTDESWLEEIKAKSAGPNARRKRDVTSLEYTVGSENCASVDTDEYCNGQLEPNTRYMLFAVACTNGGCLVSQPYGPFITLAVPDEDNNLMIIGIVVAVGVVVLIGAVVGFILLRRRKSGPGKMKPVSESDDEDFTTIDPAVAKIQRKRPILLNEIEEYVNKMHKDSNLLFSAEYEDLKTLSPKHACEAADREENRMRNRYINIIPFDHTRVKLSTNGEDDSSDYINANYLPGYSSPREYIGCQGPIPGTIDDFWRMTWEQNVSVVVMLTLCKEGQKIKCEQYWPDEVGEPKQYGDVIVEITSYSNIRTYDYRMFKITNGSTTRVVKHFHFLSWLDFQANVHHDIILDFIEHVRQHVQPPDTSGPMIIHCSAGVGRTGTYIALDHLMQFINEHDFDVSIDIFDLVLKLRENRQHMVQTEQQYVFIHDCVKEIMDRKRRQMENIYENQAFLEKLNAAQDENIYQNEQSLYENVSQAKSEQNTEL